MSGMAGPVSLEVNGRRVTVTHPDKVVFPGLEHTKLDLIRYYLSVAEGALRGVAGRPMILKRFVKGIDHEAIFQKRAPAKRPDWVDVAELRYASGTSANEAVIRDAAGLAWVINLGCIDLNPHPVLAEDLDHPDELRVDLDPMPGVEWPQILDVAAVARDVLHEHGLTAWPKTSGSRGFHIYARIAPRWSFRQVRLAAQAVAREVERRAPDLATARWWKEERQGVFVDFNQNAKDRTVASAYSVRATPDARVSTPLRWDEVAGCRPDAFTMTTVPKRVADIGDPWAGMDDAAGGLDALLALAEKLGPAEKPPKPARRSADGRRVPTMPLIEIARTKTKDEAMAALDTWRQRYPAAADRLQPADVLVDGMRGPSSIWYRIRINLQHVPPDQRPPQEDLIADYSPWDGYTGAQWRR
ncbi:DNA polymerase domain-containing protein [Mycobacterium heckeshornense]|uniref:DNA polymerase domain-containing protein n=1 Tax=Mycobacterium heckeshornense TaxID=110505 RepID=A0A2G8BC15_9MYCO|nr:DNA polymerase domain-containing protein [Mycobacterium heckeshornense]KMV23555.1 DNA polymerase [Mycobacterium heckeshornense]MCV7033039.1 DNA polymerase domain-containing protein [Mycobacterium heckeshornense]PIJ35264.1 DNA polymerase domain-containing protein [Mycobacterium heckeshornense]BCO38127.1 DNA polymerase domain-containing protein [Mycobacterium heckeshornense]BCQ10982.1 DNA polymerase domain-containing protein [Mycobacterium heckeshornense]